MRKACEFNPPTVRPFNIVNCGFGVVDKLCQYAIDCASLAHIQTLGPVVLEWVCLYVCYRHALKQCTRDQSGPNQYLNTSKTCSVGEWGK